jgi:hypothetical protein
MPPGPPPIAVKPKAVVSDPAFPIALVFAKLLEAPPAPIVIVYSVPLVSSIVFVNRPPAPPPPPCAASALVAPPPPPAIIRYSIKATSALGHSESETLLETCPIENTPEEIPLLFLGATPK